MRRWMACLTLGVLTSLVVGSTGATGATQASAGTSSTGCGSTPSKPDGSAWQCTFADDFGGDELDRSAWVPQIYHSSGTAKARACYVDDPRNVAVADGNLRLTVRRLDKPMVCEGDKAGYSAGSVSTYHTFSQQYGRFEARLKVEDTSHQGLQEAFWLWPDDRVSDGTYWPAAGEIDVVETYSYYHQLAVPFLHYTWYDNWGPRPGTNTAYCGAPRGEYHTYVLTWKPKSLTIEVDGKKCLVNTSGDRAFKKPYIMALTSALGTTGNGLVADTPIPATMDVDYVKAWR